MGLQIQEQYVQAVNSDPVVHRLHHPSFPRGFIDIPPISECPDGVALPARLFKRNCYKSWLWRAGHEPNKVRVIPSDLKMAEIREMARVAGISIPVGTTKEKAIELLNGGK